MAVVPPPQWLPDPPSFPNLSGPHPLVLPSIYSPSSLFSISDHHHSIPFQSSSSFLLLRFLSAAVTTELRHRKLVVFLIFKSSIMLHCTTSSDTSSEMSVLERQKSMFHRLCFNQQDLPPHQALFQYQNMLNSTKHHQSLDDISPNFGFNCSGIATTGSADIEQQQHQQQHQRSFSNVSANSSRSHHHHRVAAPARKRKAEVFDTEAESKEDNKTIEGEVESSCVTVKIEKGNSNKSSKANSKASESAPKTDYIHVRARRGQATDSHSLAERARREKITKKMKCLQELVPGCNKVIGKAGMLDEIINYVQSLQKQVEFLSMKLAALNPRMDFNMESFFTKELSAYLASFPTTATVTPMELMNSSYLHYNQGSANDLTPDGPAATQMMQHKAVVSSSIPCPETYLDSIPTLQQVQQISESDWQSIYNLSFH